MVAQSPAESFAQSSSARSTAAEVNAGTVGIITGPAGGTYIEVASDMSQVLDCVDGLRLLPIAGKGSVDNIRDLLFLRGVDMAIVEGDVLSYIEREGLFSSNIKGAINYVTRLFNQEIHVLAKKGIVSLEQLQGKKVNVGEPGSIPVAADLIFDSLGIDVVRTKYDNKLALERLRAGDLDAVMIVAGKPSSLLSAISNESDLAFVPIPLNDALVDNYVPAVIQSEDYPNLVSSGEEVRTISVPTVLAVYAWPEGHERYRKTKVFVDAFFERFAYFQRPARHPKWREVVLTAEVPGWTHYPPAVAQLKQREPQTATADEPSVAQASLEQTGDADFEAFLVDYSLEPNSDAEKQRMWQLFLEQGGGETTRLSEDAAPPAKKPVF